MLVPVEFKRVSKWVRVPKTEDVYSYPDFIEEGDVIAEIIKLFYYYLAVYFFQEFFIIFFLSAFVLHDQIHFLFFFLISTGKIQFAKVYKLVLKRLCKCGSGSRYIR